jgi:Flp pilus assembly protein TadG
MSATPLPASPSTRPVFRFAADRRGAVALMFGLMVLPLFGAVGLAIDFGSVMTARTKAQMASDAAALQASGVARDLIKNGDGSQTATTNAIAEAKKHGEALFKAHADQAELKDYTLNLTVTRAGQSINTVAAFSVKTDTFIGSVFGRDVFKAAGSASASSSLPTYSDVYLALDVSASMGIAGSRADMIKLFNAQALKNDGKKEKTGCVFACHVAESGRAESNTTVAKRNGVILRIDVLRDAVKAMIAEAQKDAESRPIYRLALYTLGGSLDASTWVLNKVAPLTNNFTTLNVAAATIDIQTSTSNPNTQRSYINEQLKSMAGELTQSQDGSSQDKSKKYVFLITDGARDVPSGFGNCTVPPKNVAPLNLSSSRCTNGIDPSFCKTIKDKGITMGVLYTTYIPVTEDPAAPTGKLEKWYNFEMVQTKFNNTSVSALLAPKLQECASPKWFFEASDAAGIEAAMKAMFEQTTQAPTLTH